MAIDKDRDCISREWIKTAIHNFYYGLTHTPTEEDIQAYLDAAPSIQSKTGWIPVGERLPEDGERVLVTYDKIVIRATWDLMRYSFYDTHAVSLDKDFVYAWQPLPEPYEKSEEEWHETN